MVGESRSVQRGRLGRAERVMRTSPIALREAVTGWPAGGAKLGPFEWHALCHHYTS